MVDYKDKFPEITDQELRCLEMRERGCSYDVISTKVPGASKKWIGQTLRKYNPELVNAKAPEKQDKFTEYYKKLYNILAHTDRKMWIWLNDNTEFSCYINNHQIYFDGNKLDDWFIAEQAQVFNMIINNLRDDKSK